MPPRRPLPDLVLITVFKMLTPNEQMVASLMSPRCAVLVRAANRTVKRLAITKLDFPFNPYYLEYDLNWHSLASYLAMQTLMDSCADGEPSFPHYPLITTPFNPWNVLQLGQLRLLLDTATTIEQITAVFSAVTELIFITEGDVGLASLLQHPAWQCQLTNLRMAGTWNRDSRLNRELITAINGLTALQYLSFNWGEDTDLPDLTILAQLKAVAFGSDNVRAFLPSLEQYASENVDLQVHLFSRDIEGLLTLSQPLHSRIVHFGLDVHFLDLSDATRLCSQFRFLTSLKIESIQLTEVGPLFTALSQLHQLVHLALGVYSEGDEEREKDEEDDEEELPPAPRPLAQINSLRALELYLDIESHSEIKWLNLPVTMPNLQTIYIQEFRCAICKVKFQGWRNSGLPVLNSPEALHCFQSSLFTLHSGVPLNRFILRLPVEKSMSAEKLLLQSTSEPVTTGQP